MEDETVNVAGKKFKLLPYNTGYQPLHISEYGRNIQQMVDYCVSIPDREERTACAHAIVDVMCKLFPKAISDKTNINKFWDHIFIMSDFKLDIDFPCEVVKPENLLSKPKKIPYKKDNILFRHYGRNVEGLIHVISDMDDNEERESLIYMIANQMKKTLLFSMNENVSDERIISDINFYSGGKLSLNPENYHLSEYKEMDLSKKNNKK